MAISSALEISIDSPNSVKVGERFYVSIDADTTETNDVKIFVHDSTDDKITQNEYISEIYGDEWQSSWNYVKEVFPEDKRFKLIVTDSPGDREICVRLRESSTKKTYLKCQEIRIRESSKEENITEDLPIEESPKENLKEVNYKAEAEEKIILTPKKEKLEVITKNQKTRSFIIYSLISFLVILIILISIRKL